MVKWSLNKISNIPDTYAWNSKGTGKFGGIGLRQAMSTEYPALANTLCRLEARITSSTQDALGNWHGEVDMDMLDIATDRPIAKVSMQASKDIKCDSWAINSVSVNKTDNALTNLQQNEEGFESTPLSIEEVVVTANKSDRLPTGERVAVSLSESESVEVLSMAFDALPGVDATLGDTKKFKARDGKIEGTSHQRQGRSKVTYKSNLSTGEEITVMDSDHTRNIGSSQLAKYRRVESQGCVTSTYIHRNLGSEPFTYSTIALDSELTPCALVTYTVPHLGSDSNDIPRGVISVNTELPNNAALFTSKNLNMSWATVDQPIEK